MKIKGFTLIELLIVIALLGTLSLALLIALDPQEQMNKGSDVTLLTTAKDLNDALYRYNTATGKLPYSTELKGVSLDDPSINQVIETLITNEDLKEDFLPQLGKDASRLFMSGDMELTHFTVCFIPKSKQYIKHTDTHFDKEGNSIDCTQNTCYFCLGQKPELSGDQSVISSPVLDTGCTGFDPEKPDYPWTCNISSKWTQYKCTNYCVADKGCDSFCPAGQRHLVKVYSAPTSGDSEMCNSHSTETNEDYCVSGSAANCVNMSYPSSTSDFEWGCVNPIRPYKWK